MPTAATSGLHHVTAIVGSAAGAVAVYRDLLGLRLVKRTVNFDDPSMPHLYFGDRWGSPGSVFTVFPIAGAHETNHVGPRFARVGFVVAPGSLDFWRGRLRDAGVSFDQVGSQLHFDGSLDSSCPGVHLSIEEDTLADDTARDSDEADDGASRLADSTIPPEHRLRGLDGPLIDSDAPNDTAAFLRDVLGFIDGRAHADDLRRFDLPGGDSSDTSDVGAGPGKRLCVRAAAPGRHRPGAGDVHHVAWTVPDRVAQDELRRRLVEAGLSVSPVLDRTYFSSIYVRIPGGVLFEFATVGPGFTADEDEAGLGTSLKLPASLEPDRERIEAALPPIEP